MFISMGFFIDIMQYIIDIVYIHITGFSTRDSTDDAI